MKLLTRIHEWAADRFDFVQYPNVRGPKPQFFKHQMPLSARIFLIAASLVTIAVALVILGFLTIVTYSAVS